MSGLPNPSRVATIVLPGEDDPQSMLLGGRFDLQWGETKVRKFREVKIPHDTNADLALPTLYLHFLDDVFRTKEGAGLHQSLRSGNDMSEVIVKLPAKFLTSEFAERCNECQAAVTKVVKALQGLGEMFVNSMNTTAGDIEPDTMFFSLKTARPKASISLDKKAFGIPMDAEQYLFVNNHASVVHFDDDLREAFNECIEGLQDVGFPNASKFAVFLKVFYEGGFGYNKKISMGQGYLPVNVGTAAMSVVPAFEGQVGIGTGYPYKLTARFLPFTETVPISIDAIKQMSPLHGRYGLAFTRTVYIWEGDAFASEKTLDFCSILPHGGFFYLPGQYAEYQKLGGYVYAFGESTDDAPELAQS